MKKLVLRALLNVFGFSLLIVVFGWFFHFHPGQSSLIDLEFACARQDHLHLFCTEGSAGLREGWSFVYTPEGKRQLEQQMQLARTLYNLPADFSFKPWHSQSHQSDPIGRLIRARPARQLLVLACLAAPGLPYLPHIVHDQWMRRQLSAVVGQDFKLLWNEHDGNYGIVVILKRPPAAMEQAIRLRLRLRPQDQLAVVGIDSPDSPQMPPFFPQFLGVELLVCGWAIRRWMVRRRALPV